MSFSQIQITTPIVTVDVYDIKNRIPWHTICNHVIQYKAHF
jgi:hypothetical protein